MIAGGAAAAVGPLRRRLAYDQANRTAYIALGYDDVAEISVRSGVPLTDLLHRFWHAGATHLALPEDTLGRWLARGSAVIVAPRQPLADLPAAGHWTYLAAHEAELLSRLQRELAARQPHLDVRFLEEDGRSLLALGGDLLALQDLGLGFDRKLAQLAQEAGLQPLPRPTSYAWPTAATIDRTLAQAAEACGVGEGTAMPAMVAFQGLGAPGHIGELLLGHEMLMHETIGGLRRHKLALAYFAESRHQRGDWFVAKSLAPNVILAHEFTQAQLIAEDKYSAAYRWGLLAREKGIRLCLLQPFKVVHATTPLDNVGYVAAVADALVNREGLILGGRPDFRPKPVGHDHHHHHHHHGQEHQQGAESADQRIGGQVAERTVEEDSSAYGFASLPRDDKVLPWLALVPAGTGLLVAADGLRLPNRAITLIALAGLASPLLIRQLDRPANELEATFRPSYAPKLIALGISTLAPLAAALAGHRRSWSGLLVTGLIQGGAALGLAATVADHDYALRVEALPMGQLDWVVPLAGSLAVAAFPGDAPRLWRAVTAVLTGLTGLAIGQTGILPADPLALLDNEHSVQHTHHLSRAQAALGDARMAVSPRPLRKWTMLTLGVQLAAALLPGRVADIALVPSSLGSAAFLVGFRQAARPFARTWRDRL
jgi:hypothetical protein